MVKSKPKSPVMTSIFDLFTGKSELAQARWDQLRQETGKFPTIAWYPSCGKDFRDLHEVERTPSPPQLHIHTDYFYSQNRFQAGEEVYRDYGTLIVINSLFELQAKSTIDYQLNRSFVDFPAEAPLNLKSLLLYVEVKSLSKELSFIKPVLFLYKENINFLDEVLLGQGMRISHFIKVREGCGMGGNRKSVSIAYAFLANLRVQYLLVDHEEHTDFTLIAELIEKHAISPKNYSLQFSSSGSVINNTSGFVVRVLQLEPKCGFLDQSRLESILSYLSNNC